MEDPIQSLLSSMGWSCDDLLKKLEQYKHVSKTNNKEAHHSSESISAEESNEDTVTLKTDSSIQSENKTAVEQDTSESNGKDFTKSPKHESDTEVFAISKTDIKDSTNQNVNDEEMIRQDTENTSCSSVSSRTNVQEETVLEESEILKKSNRKNIATTLLRKICGSDDVNQVTQSDDEECIIVDKPCENVNNAIVVKEPGGSEESSIILIEADEDEDNVLSEDVTPLETEPTSDNNLQVNETNKVEEPVSLVEGTDVSQTHIEGYLKSPKEDKAANKTGETTSFGESPKSTQMDQLPQKTSGILLGNDEMDVSSEDQKTDAINENEATTCISQNLPVPDISINCAEAHTNELDTNLLEKAVCSETLESTNSSTEDKDESHVFLKPVSCARFEIVKRNIAKQDNKQTEKNLTIATKSLVAEGDIENFKTPIVTQEEDDEPEPEPKKDEEEVRNLLRMQISQLRNKKKIDVIASTIDKNIITRTVPESKKKKRKMSGDHIEVTSKKIAIDTETSNKKDNLNDVLLSNENESEFLIIDVVGGYKSPEQEETKTVEAECPSIEIINKHLDGEPIHLTKTRNYMDIKGWRHKKLAIAVEEREIPKKVPFFDEAVPSCSYTNLEAEKLTVASYSEPKQEKHIKSAFESNLLDQFLVENATLNISYEVPKLDAEENISQNYDDLLVPVKTADVNLDKISDGSEEKKSCEIYKPKTLAEKRKMIEKFEKRKIVKRENPKEGANEINMYYSRIYCKGTTLKVPTRVRYTGFFYYITKRGSTKGQRRFEKPYVYVSPKNEKPKINSKPSLLTSLKCSSLDKISYKPGPLSMKRKLQKRHNDWITVIKKLPKITLQVTPEYCKSIDPRVVDYVKFEGTVITEERVDFALTALKSKENSSKSFNFPVSYKNGEEFMLLRTRQPHTPPEQSDEIKKEDDETAVRTVIDKLLNYVDVSEIADSIIKQDTEERVAEKSDFVKPLTPISKNVDTIIKNSRKKKTSLELKRLNVKIIDVDVAEKEDDGNCLKPFCKMGCVCKSLECNKSYIFHCGKEECMLKCACNHNKPKHLEDKVILPAGTNLLSVGTVSHLQNQAKRNLAKLEKDFVQTVIQSNDQTIILGSGTRDRQRRATKLPRKMSDYIGDDILNNIEEQAETEIDRVSEEKSKKVESNAKKKCVVKVLRLDLSDVIPFCLVHNLYDCHCGYQAEYPTPDSTKVHKVNVKKQTIETRESEAENSVEISKKSPERKREPTPTRCSRTREVPTEAYRVRNSAIGYLDRLKKLLVHKEKKISSALSKTQKNSLAVTSISNTHKNKRNIKIQSEPFGTIDLSKADHGLEIINIPPEKAIQRRKKKVSIGSISSTETVNMPSLLDQSTEKVKGPSARSLTEELGRYLSKTSKNKVELLPWDVLVNRYQDGTLQVWCNIKAKKVLITENHGRPTKHYVNVNFLENILPSIEQIDIDIIRCLITNKVPKNKDPSEVLLVLTWKGTYFEVCGMCEKSCASVEGVSLSLMSSELNQELIEEKADASNCEETFLHKTMEDELKLIPLTRVTYPRQVLRYQYNPNNLMQVCLPAINKNQKWCMVKLANRFSYLKFTTIPYSINRADLNDLIKLAKASQQTLVLQSKYFNKGDPNEFKQNIYIIPNYQDRLFIGPYFKTDEAKIETLEYVNRVLVNTDLYSKMKGELSQNCAWMIQVCNFSQTIQYNQTAIQTNRRSLLKSSITKPNSKETPELVIIDDDDSGDEDAQADSSDGDDDDVVLVKDKEYLEEGNLKRYLTTNVPGLGYIEAYQLPESKIVDVKWPFSNNIQRYSKIEDAVSGIQRQLSMLLISIPNSFKLEVHVVDQVDGTMSPMSPNYAQGHYGVGTFGVRDLVVTRASALPASCGVTDEDIFEMLLNRSRKVLFKYCMKFAEILTTSDYTTIEDVLNGGVEEIKQQQEMFDSFNKAKIALELKRVDLLKKCFKLMKALPRDKEKEVRQHLHSIIHNKKQDTNLVNQPESETILIEISDDEEEKQNNSAELAGNVEKNVPGLIKIKNGSLNATKKYIQSNKLLMSSVKAQMPSKPLLSTQRNYMKIPINKVLNLDKKPGKKFVLALRENTDSDIIKRLKMNTGLQVSVLNKESQSTNKHSEGIIRPMQKCEIMKVRDNSGIKCVSVKKKLSTFELRQCLILKPQSTSP